MLVILQKEFCQYLTVLLCDNRLKLRSLNYYGALMHGYLCPVVPGPGSGKFFYREMSVLCRRDI